MDIDFERAPELAQQIREGLEAHKTGLKFAPVDPGRHALIQAARRVARLNPDAGEIGEGMLRAIIAEAREALALAGVKS